MQKVDIAGTAENLGPLWYPIALVLTMLPCAWLGGVLFARGDGTMPAAR